METLSTFLADVTTVFSTSITWLSDVMDTIIGHPLSFVMVAGLGLVGFAFGITSRLIRM